MANRIVGASVGTVPTAISSVLFRNNRATLALTIELDIQLEIIVPCGAKVDVKHDSEGCASDGFDVFRDQFRVVGLLRRMHFAIIFVVFILINTLVVDQYLAFEEV